MIEDVKKNLEIFKEIQKLDLTEEQKAVEFQKRTGRARASYFRYKKFLNGKSECLGDSPSHRELRKHYREFICYFCGVATDVRAHHRNGDRDDNSIDNLLMLCKNCHPKLHYILKTDAKFWVELPCMKRKVNE